MSLHNFTRSTKTNTRTRHSSLMSSCNIFGCTMPTTFYPPNPSYRREQRQRYTSSIMITKSRNSSRNQVNRLTKLFQTKESNIQTYNNNSSLPASIQRVSAKAIISKWQFQKHTLRIHKYHASYSPSFVPSQFHFMDVCCLMCSLSVLLCIRRPDVRIQCTWQQLNESLEFLPQP